MTGYILTAIGAIVAHKGWRAAWMIRRGASVATAVRREFAPPDERKATTGRPRRVTEVA